jgi:hypothetical protein
MTERNTHLVEVKGMKKYFPITRNHDRAYFAALTRTH